MSTPGRLVPGELVPSGEGRADLGCLHPRPPVCGSSSAGLGEGRVEKGQSSRGLGLPSPAPGQQREGMASSPRVGKEAREGCDGPLRSPSPACLLQKRDSGAGASAGGATLNRTLGTASREPAFARRPPGSSLLTHDRTERQATLLRRPPPGRPQVQEKQAQRSDRARLGLSWARTWTWQIPTPKFFPWGRWKLPQGLGLESSRERARRNWHLHAPENPCASLGPPHPHGWNGGSLADFEGDPKGKGAGGSSQLISFSPLLSRVISEPALGSGAPSSPL